MRALVIGADGFVGRWLVRHLIEQGDDVITSVGPSFDASRWPFPIESHQVDVRDPAKVAAVVDTSQPEVIYDLAGVSEQGMRDDGNVAIGVSVVGSMNLLLAASRLPNGCRLIFVSTSYVYRPSPGPIDEDGFLQPSGLYAAAKLAAEQSLLALAPHLGLEVLIARPFNHFGPGQGPSFIMPQLASQIVEARASASTEVHVRDATVVRDFTDVRDVVTAYRILAAAGARGTAYNVASGIGVSIRDLAQRMAKLEGVDVTVQSGAEADTALPLIGDAQRLRSLGWTARSNLEEGLAEVLAEARSRGNEPERPRARRDRIH